MGWKETCAVSERMRFVLEVTRGERSIAECCRLAGISRKTGYKWLERYDEGGALDLVDRSRAPHEHPNAVPLGIKAMLLEARAQHPSWGAVKLLGWLSRRHPKQRFPAPSTVSELLKRAGMVKPRRRSGRTPPYTQPFMDAMEPNAIWSADFKGEFRTADGRYCYPLTLSDGYSRYLLACRGLLRPSSEGVWPWFERVFREYGLPLAIRTDNGAPFASRGVGGLSALSAWWVRLGIRPERIAPGCPQQNGRHERMHRTLKGDSLQPPRASLAAQQRAFEQFRLEYNEERPHEALGQRTPADLYQPSSREYPSRLPEVHYPQGFLVRRVRYQGTIKWKGGQVYVGQALRGEPIGLYQTDEETWRVYYAALELGRLDARAARIEPKTMKSVTHVPG
jgi:transposase InsO family protein